MARQKQKPEDRNKRRPPFDILSRRVGRFFATFFGLWALLFAVSVCAGILDADDPPDGPKIVIIVFAAAATTAVIAFPLAVGIVEGIPMVLAKMYTDSIRAEAHEEGLEEGHEKGLEEGREKGLEEGLVKGREEGEAIGARQMLTRWREWNRRRLAAAQAGQPFTEPEPDLD